jgi:hypothetical protein
MPLRHAFHSPMLPTLPIVWASRKIRSQCPGRTDVRCGRSGGRKARAGRFEVVEGPARERHVVIAFESYEAALACYRCPEYQAAANCGRPMRSRRW